MAPAGSKNAPEARAREKIDHLLEDAVGYVVGALGAAGGAVLWLTAPKGVQERSARVWIGPGAAGLGGQF
jgi:hypothetical protein